MLALFWRVLERVPYKQVATCVVESEIFGSWPRTHIFASGLLAGLAVGLATGCAYGR